MAKTKWIGKGHTASWFAPQNWTANVPYSGESTVFSGARSWAVSLDGSIAATSGEMMVLGDAVTFSSGTLALAAAQPKNGYPVDLAIGKNGSVTVSASATLSSHYIIDVGSVAAGTLTPGGLIVQGTVDGAFLDVYDGTAQVVGPSAHVALIYDGYSADVADGSLTVSAGGTLDAGPNTLSNEYSGLSIGGTHGDGAVSVTGAGSMLSVFDVTVGSGASGTLLVSAGGIADIHALSSGTYGATQLSISGTGSQLNAVSGISLGDDTNLSGLTLSITDGGSVNAGTYGLALRYGSLVLDASAQLIGPIYSQVGQIGATAVSASTPGIVTLTQAITLDTNLGAQGQYAYTTDVYSVHGAVLVLDGQITDLGGATLSAAGGSVVLDNGTNSYSATSIYDAKLEIAATGAAGAGAVTFLSHTAANAVLQIDSGVSFANVILGFAGKDAIDLRGFGFLSGVSDTYAAGKLTLSNGSTTDTFSLSGKYSAATFAFADDHHGGTLITYAPHG